MHRFLLSLLLAHAVQADTASDLIEQSGVKGGLVVHVGAADAKLTTGLRPNASYQVQALTRDPATLATLRSGIGTAYGESAPICSPPPTCPTSRIW
jgi:hypothetical protein